MDQGHLSGAAKVAHVTCFFLGSGDSVSGSSQQSEKNAPLEPRSCETMSSKNTSSALPVYSISPILCEARGDARADEEMDAKASHFNKVLIDFLVITIATIILIVAIILLKLVRHMSLVSLQRCQVLSWAVKSMSASMAVSFVGLALFFLFLW